jgi:hypothetical protein
VPENIEFKTERLLVTDEQLESWLVSMRNEAGMPIQVRGPCPRCGHETAADIELGLLAMTQSGQHFALPPPRERITRVVDCECDSPHPRPLPPGAAPAAPSGPPTPPPSEDSCGRWWLVSVPLAAGVDQAVRAGDQSLLDAARAVQAALATEETRIRTSAEKWIAGVAALLTLFGLSGVVVGKDGFAGLPTSGASAAAVLAAVALAAAGGAVLFSYRAAYGWPVPVDIGDDDKLREWFSKRRKRLHAAASDLQNSVKVACLALAALAGAVAIIWFWPREDPKPMVRVTLEDESFVCGHLLASKDDGTMRVLSTDGVVTMLEISSIQRVHVPDKCPTSGAAGRS